MSVGEHPACWQLRKGTGPCGRMEGTRDRELGCLPLKYFQLSSREKTLLLAGFESQDV